MIDIIVYLTGQTDLTFNTFELDDKIYSASRDGYQELCGKLIATTGRGDILEMIDHNSSTGEALEITIKTNKEEIIIDEIHNIRISDDNQDKRVAIELYKLVESVDNLRLLLLSAQIR